MEFNETLMKVVVFDPNSLNEGRVLGKGGFGQVIMGLYSRLEIAIKKFFTFNLKSFLKEFNIIQKLKHQNIPSLYGVVPNVKSLSLVSELIKGETLDSFFRKVGENCFVKVCMFIELANVITYIHCLKLIHRDLKPSNIMVDHNLNIKLLDFGISKLSSNTNTQTVMTGTILYMAPENYSLDTKGMSMEEFAMSIISTKVDVWAFGCILSEAYSGYRPWAPSITMDTGVIAMLIKKQNFRIPKNLENSEITSIIESCTEVNPTNRKNIRDIKNDLIGYLYSAINSMGMVEIEKSLDFLTPKLSK